MPRQINVQLPQRTIDILEAAAYLDEQRSIQNLMRPPLERLAEELETDSEIAAIVQARRKRRAKANRDPVPNLADRRDKGRRGS